uniref:Uncharacterized protein n=1 Tax=Oryza brachyantha TaxID=4533 RepID=J3ML85_ORYBR
MVVFHGWPSTFRARQWRLSYLKSKPRIFRETFPVWPSTSRLGLTICKFFKDLNGITRNYCASAHHTQSLLSLNNAGHDGCCIRFYVQRQIQVATTDVQCNESSTPQISYRELASWNLDDRGSNQKYKNTINLPNHGLDF